jgi:hypothetical protein
MGKKKTFIAEDETNVYFQGEGRECPVCRQEFLGSCPLNNADCPCVEREEADAETDEEKPDSDFEDVEKLDEVLEEDKEADRLTEDEEEFGEEDER